MIPLNERAGYQQFFDLVSAAELRTGEKLLERLSTLAEAEDKLVLLAAEVPDMGACIARVRKEGLKALANFLVQAILAAPDKFLNEQILMLRNFAEEDRQASFERERSRLEKEEVKRQGVIAAGQIAIAVEAEKMDVRQIFAELERDGIRLSLEGEKIVALGGRLSDRHRILIRTRRRHLVDMLEGRQYSERV
jgi:hypothetical protein